MIVDIIGDGPQRAMLEKQVKKHKLRNVNFLGYKKNKEIPQLMSTHDILVLPSVYDGWGAVVNEALQNGLYVICSDKCGAKDMLRHEMLGMVFKGGCTEDLIRCLQFAEDHIDEIKKCREQRLQWANDNISGKAIARYMVDCIEGNAVSPPWRNEFCTYQMIN